MSPRKTGMNNICSILNETMENAGKKDHSGLLFNGRIA